jgi:4-deoxy-L-threo-5-hexosulose-uronate ketol-isomerase
MSQPEMEVRHAAAPADIARATTDELRARFVVQGIFPADHVRLVYSHIDRLILGGAMPVRATVELGDGSAIGTPFLLSAREMGIANLGGPARVTVDGQAFELARRDILYVGRGSRRIRLESRDPTAPAKLYLNSCAAQETYPCRLIRRDEAKPLTMGDAARANLRTLRMYIHPEVAPSALLLMGITDPAPGSVWNTMPCHVHERRMEAYLYADMGPEDRVFHFMGRPDATRHLIVANDEAVISPSWSIHMGAGTGPYAFVWGMTGENQEYNDADPVALADMR